MREAFSVAVGLLMLVSVSAPFAAAALPLVVSGESAGSGWAMYALDVPSARLDIRVEATGRQLPLVAGIALFDGEGRSLGTGTATGDVGEHGYSAYVTTTEGRRVVGLESQSRPESRLGVGFTWNKQTSDGTPLGRVFVLLWGAGRDVSWSHEIRGDATLHGKTEGAGVRLLDARDFEGPVEVRAHWWGFGGRAIHDNTAVLSFANTPFILVREGGLQGGYYDIWAETPDSSRTACPCQISGVSDSRFGAGDYRLGYSAVAAGGGSFYVNALDLTPPQPTWPAS